MNKKLIERIQELFFLKLEDKTGWGKLDIKDAYRDCVAQALLEFIDQ
jgi:hypothetical protein